MARTVSMLKTTAHVGIIAGPETQKRALSNVIEFAKRMYSVMDALGNEDKTGTLAQDIAVVEAMADGF